MDSAELADRVGTLAALADPARRRLYLFVAAQPESVSRDQASEAAGIARHTVKFHLDKLVEQGLLDVEYRRPSGRRGPGAGRPTKMYRRSALQVSVTLPDRHYELAAELLAGAVDESTRTGAPVLESLRDLAAGRGAGIADLVRERLGPRAGRRQRLAAIRDTLSAHGYEPRQEDGTVTLANCPFDALARSHTQLVCGMNLALLDGLAGGAGGGTLHARLDPAPGRCCVVLDTAAR